MDSIKLSRGAVIAISAAFALLLLAGAWWKLNPAWNGKHYYKDAARLQATEGELAPNGATAVPPPAATGRSSDRAYQPESGN